MLYRTKKLHRHPEPSWLRRTRSAAQQQRRDDAGQEAEARPEVQDRGVLGAAEEGAQAERVAGLVADHVSDFLSKSLFFSPIVVYICRNVTNV